MTYKKKRCLLGKCRFTRDFRQLLKRVTERKPKLGGFKMEWWNYNSTNVLIWKKCYRSGNENFVIGFVTPNTKWRLIYISLQILI